MTALDFYIDGLKAKGFSDEKIKELTEHNDLPWLQFAEDYHKKQLTIPNVSQQRELLKAFDDWCINNEGELSSSQDVYIDKFLNSL